MSELMVVTISGITSPEDKEVMMGLLYAIEHEGMEEGDDDLKLYLETSLYWSEEVQTVLRDLAMQFGVELEAEVLPEKNWNEAWESNFDPVQVENWAGIRASFHPPTDAVKYDILIDPKMSFGTGHHATTWQMLQLMQWIPFRGKTVLDLGSGTGLLAILAAMLDASGVVAIDNDPWCRENALENCRLNGQDDIEVLLGELHDVVGKYDIILANIQRNFLVEHMGPMKEKLLPGGYLFISGFFAGESNILLDAALEQGLIAHYHSSRDNWAAIILHNKQV